ncbi:fumarylacetoacetate hydrolase family protein [Opitutus sp. GAS368]|uniref:fumarylacetoacetate hydrolase family protein n=1 Tax=Opitutus sp. GAS368 TaxID=1882749 RepID=UPI00087D9AD2|nr:fumarylacetoacetate hydrolase family protein [Opitutus sp. GAS368]SDR82607.1 2-keto-4-pentenoate hydratase/2-oxohepta-3-ene-1,7-dioic acid hydratase (catechol pathway) [Opitutus sp. GAS368]
MKLIRHLTPTGPAWAALQPDGSARAVEGDILGSWRVTDKTVKPGKLLAPIAPAMIVCIGLNYAKHAAEGGKPPPERPVWFMKLPGAVVPSGDPIRLPAKQPSTKVDYEAELAIVLGQECRNATRANALDFVLGYTCANDVSARDWQRDFGGGQWNHAKSFDTFCPLGPVLVTRDEVPQPNALRIRSILNGQTMQDSNTADMIFDVPAIIEFLSADKTLPAGTLILTGTPEGVGFARNPPVWLKAGDTIVVEIEKIGTLTNPVIN